MAERVMPVNFYKFLHELLRTRTCLVAKKLPKSFRLLKSSKNPQLHCQHVLPANLPMFLAQMQFDKILTRFAIQAKGSDGKWTRKPLAYRESNNVHLLIARPPEICVNLVVKHIHAASSYTICRQFVPFIYCPL